MEALRSRRVLRGQLRMVFASIAVLPMAWTVFQTGSIGLSASEYIEDGTTDIDSSGVTSSLEEDDVNKDAGTALVSWNVGGGTQRCVCQYEQEDMSLRCPQNTVTDS